jgi:hypothetical protein
MLNFINVNCIDWSRKALDYQCDIWEFNDEIWHCVFIKWNWHLIYNFLNDSIYLWAFWLWFENSLQHSHIYKLGTKASPCIRASSVRSQIWGSCNHVCFGGEATWQLVMGKSLINYTSVDPWLKTSTRVAFFLPVKRFQSQYRSLTTQPNEVKIFDKECMTFEIWFLIYLNHYIILFIIVSKV